LAFINAILRSEYFPPHDPWLSGFAISYYYFGYVIISMIAKITATPGSVAFNLGISLVFSLTAIGTYGIVFNLLNSKNSSYVYTQYLFGAFFKCAPVANISQAGWIFLSPEDIRIGPGSIYHLRNCLYSDCVQECLPSHTVYKL